MNNSEQTGHEGAAKENTARATSTDERGPFSATGRSAALLAASSSTFCTAFLISSLNVALPALQKEFGLNAVFLGWIAMTSVLTSAMFVVPFGRLGDMLGRRRIFTYGLVAFVVASALCSMAGSPATLIAGLILQSIGAAMIFATSTAIVTTVYPAEKRGKALGVMVGVVYFGLSSGPFLGGLLTGYFGWRTIFLPVIPVGIFALFLVRLRLQDEVIERRNERFDLSGAVVFSLSLVAVLSGFSMLPALAGFFVIAAGIAGGILFFRLEEKAPNPILRVDFLKTNRVFAFSNLAALIHYSATSATTFLMSLYLQFARGMSPQHAGLILVCQPLVQAIVTPFAGWLSDKREPRLVASAGMATTGIGLVFLSLISDTTSMAVIIAILALLGVGFSFFSSPNSNAIMSSIDKKFYGVGSGILATSRMIGQSFSMGFTTLVFALYLGHVQITPSLYPVFLKSAKLLFLFFAVLCCVSIAASLARGKVRTSDVDG
jgi:MFS family permease